MSEKAEAVVAPDGAVLIPAAILEQLGLAAGSRLLVTPKKSGILLALPAVKKAAAAKAPAAAAVAGLPVAAIAGSPPPAPVLAGPLDLPLLELSGVGPKIGAALAAKGLVTVGDALFHLPHRYDDRRQLKTIAELVVGAKEQFCATVLEAGVKVTRSGKSYFRAVVADDSGRINLTWFKCSMRYMEKLWQPGKVALVLGEVGEFRGERDVAHPDVDWLEPGETPEVRLARDPLAFGAFLPVYPLTEGVQQKALRKIMRQVVDRAAGHYAVPLPADLLARQQLLPIAQALQAAHFPGADADPELLDRGETAAMRTLAFDEFFFLQLGLARRRQAAVTTQGITFAATFRYINPLLRSLPFKLTGAQLRVLGEIRRDMESPYPMHRLVQGDVGSGKTMVALCAALVAVESGYQVAVVAPTEILAEQHFLGMQRNCAPLGVTVGLLSSSMAAKEKQAVLEQAAAGTIQILVGTHAVLEPRVVFARLGLGIVDEQHRFGVAQRAALKAKGHNPDILVMTATPIPRTMALTVYGDLAVSVIDELPPGRSPIATRMVRNHQRQGVYKLIRREVEAGRQAYVIYPLVEESEKSDLKAATQMADELQQLFSDLKVAVLHGKMTPTEKDAVMAQFKSGAAHIMVSTTVIEVGIDVPNATVMVIEHAERFGLAQLHQLRGRVGRGQHASYCVLLASNNLSEDGLKRMQVMEQTTDGFKIAEADLEIRGPGDFIGTRQSGLPDLRVANVMRDARILEEARTEAFRLLAADPHLARPEHRALAAELARRWGGERLDLAIVA